jgi:hypothetical protein
MGSLHTLSAPPPALFVTGSESAVTNAYFAVSIDAAVDLPAVREYKELPRPARLARARAEEQRFLEGFLDPALGAALDLRVIADPRASMPVSVALIGRVWGGTGVAARAEGLRRQVHAALPRHVTATSVADAQAVARLLQPFHSASGNGAALDSAVIARHELIGQPNRPDSGVQYYYSAGPFNWSENDWSAVYAALAASKVPVVLSVAVLPMQVPAQFGRTLLTLATFYGRMARGGDPGPGLYQAGLRLAPDPFAVDAEQKFNDFYRRLAQRAFALRIQVSAAGQLPPGLVETIAEAISPAAHGASFPGRQHAASAHEVRRPGSVPERRLAEYNLNVIDFRMLTGRAEIWGRPDPPDPQLAMLTVLGDARDAGCAFRFPLAVDGVVPGFRVERGQFGPAGADTAETDSAKTGSTKTGSTEPDRARTGQADGPLLRLGTAAGPDRAISVPVKSLTAHALIAGAAGSGKTSTALQLLRQLWAEHHVPFLVIEPVNADTDDYRKLAVEPGFESLEVITVGDESGRPLRFNPFEVPAGILVGEHTANLLACFTAASGLTAPLPSRYQDALNLTYLRAGFLPSERPDGAKRTWPTVVEFLAAMREVVDDLTAAGGDRAGIEAASVRRARQLVRGTAGSVFLTDRQNDIGRLLDHPVILELKSLGPGDERALMMALLLNAVAEHHQSGPATGELVHVTVIEEAHRLLERSPGGEPARAVRAAQAKEKAAEAFADILAKNRRYGAGVIITEQIPGKLVADAVKNVNLKVVHRLTAEDDRRYLGETMGMDEQQRVLASRLGAGEALLFSDEGPFSDGGAELPAAVHLRISSTLRAGAPPASAVRPAAAPPFAACDRCRAQCDYRGAALSMLSDPRIVAGIGRATDAVEQPGLSPAAHQSALAGLASDLFAAVGTFAALPSAAPGRNDAAYCLLLHALATGSARIGTQWPEVATRLLGISPESNAPHDPLEDR